MVSEVDDTMNKQQTPNLKQFYSISTISINRLTLCKAIEKFQKYINKTTFRLHDCVNFQAALVQKRLFGGLMEEEEKVYIGQI